MRFSKVSVLIPTRKRPGRLRTLLDSYARTTEGASAESELVFRVDDDDLETRDLLIACGQRLIAIGPRYHGYRSMPVFFNEMAVISTGDVLMCGNDDMVFKTRYWAPLIIAEANHYPDGLFNFGVMTHNADHWPFSVVSRRAVDALGFIWDPRVFWGDIYLRDAMAAFGRAIPLPTVEIDHDWVGWQPDQEFVEADQQSIMRRDPEYWNVTHLQAVIDAVAVLKGLQAVV